ncbi:hypothetical protein GCM10022403_064550 [Streptomyces coacervatus]|uniref:Lipoprotein n=1 Tax=Streptomyces coacervatus TaxID=647381 RepID=A0ABP7IME6_9ACTN|nr:hypothetical protein [Streptomyces coacervatus]MDF2268741.1 hypothetical protein [Streptomyces coacervatus]
MRNKTIWPVLGAAVLLSGACSGNQAHHSDCVHVVDETTGRTGASCLPLAPKSDRVDLSSPRFTHPGRITNPLHPTAQVAQTVYGGQESGKPFRTEVTLLPGTKTITWGNRTIHAVTSQYVAFSAGRVVEVADDYYAQADDGSVWYLGETVFNYDNGVVADTEGTWQAGHKHAPGAMIMPAHPHKGDVYRTENDPGVVFEQVTVRAAGQTVDGPYGRIKNAITVHELHMDGTTEDKVFAPGYGEFSTGSAGGDLEAVSLAVPTDATRAPVPAGLAALDRAVRTAHAGPAPATVRAVREAWDAYRASDAVPALLVRQMTRDLDAWRKAPQDRAAALRAEQNTTDLLLRHEPLKTVERARLDMWARQLGIDARARDAGSVAGDVTGLELVRQRGSTPKSAVLTADLAKAREAADRKDTAAAGRIARQLTEDIAALR